MPHVTSSIGRITDMWHSEKPRLQLQESLFLTEIRAEIRAQGVCGSSFGLTCAGGASNKSSLQDILLVRQISQLPGEGNLQPFYRTI
jgi:hypothetical protein